MRIIQEVIEANFTDIIIKTELPPRGTATTEELVDIFRKEVEEQLLTKDLRGKRIILSGPNILSNSAFISAVAMLRGAKEVLQEQADGGYISVLNKELFIRGYIPLQPGMRIKADIEALGRYISDTELIVLSVSTSRSAPFRYNVRDVNGNTLWVDSNKVYIKDIL